MQKNEKGFTLLELVLVVVIASLLIYSILQGFALLDNAKSKRLIEDVESIRAAHYSFKDRFGRLPGEVAENVVGNCNAIDNATDDFFGELALQGFIVSGNPVPPSGVATRYSVSNVSSQELADANDAIFINANQFCIVGVEGKVAQGVDFKLDDGVSNSGIVQAETAIDTSAANYQSEVFVSLCIRL